MKPHTDTTSAPVTSIHHEVIRNALPAWLSSTTLPRVKALKALKPRLPIGHQHAAPAQRKALHQALQGHWLAQNNLDRALAGVLDVQAFAKPLLEQALKKQFGLQLDVQLTWLHLYTPTPTSWWTHDFKAGLRSRSVSLLDAALHNFVAGETFHADSEFISRPDAQGHYSVKPLKSRISLEQFKTLCRELDLGALYDRHLKQHLMPEDAEARDTLRQHVTFSQKAALRVAAHMARMSNDIDQGAFEVIHKLIAGHAHLNWNGQAVDCYNLSMMDASLTGIVLIAPKAFSYDKPAPLIAYVPHDPQYPLKQYASSLDFMARLTRQLREDASGQYQRFFSQFVDQRQRGHFFSNLNDRLSQIKWRPAPAGSNLPSWRETPVDTPHLQFALSPIQEDRQTRFVADRWEYFYQQKFNKIFNDAREIAISTEYADRMARWAWWDNLEKILSDLLTVTVMVVAPFVPVLGELLLAYTAYQLLDGVFEGVVDLAEGRLAEAGEQALGVLENVVQMAVFAGATGVAQAVGLRLSPFVENMRPVQLANGETRLWNPDLTPYRLADQALPATARADAQGLYALGDKQNLRLDQHLYEVAQDPLGGEHRIRHPQRPEAYAPRLKHNAQGAWVCETENPREWQEAQLLRRISHRTEGFSDARLQQVRKLSGTDENVLRRVHVENAPPPPLLIDTLERLGQQPPVATTTAPSPEARQLMLDCPPLTAALAERVIGVASPMELQHITQSHRVPLRLRTTARELAFELQSVRAAQGLESAALSNIDSERLMLGALRQYSAVFGDLRIEIREATFTGELRCSAGADSAPRLRVLVRVATDHYRVCDGEGQTLHESAGLYEAILHATQHDGQSALGYQVTDGERFKQWVIAKTTPPAVRRTLLARPPIRPVAQPQTLYLLRGGALTKSGATLHERIEDLHPHFTPREVNAYADALIAQGGDPLKTIETHENELDEIRTIVHRWRYQQPGPQAFREFRDGGGLHIYERLLQCFERKNEILGNRADPTSLALDLSREAGQDQAPIDLETWWSKRPELKKYLDKVTVLKLDNTRFSVELNGLLKDFAHLQELSARNCQLRRLPKHIRTSLRQLQRLRLSDNRIVLDASAVEYLSRLTYLEVLRLEDNPLQRSPDLSRMPRLKVVILKNTGLTAWPAGTLARPRPRGFLLDLRGNPLTSLPDVATGSDGQWLVARTRLDVGALSDIDKLRYQNHRRAMQLPPEPDVSANNALENRAILSSYGNDYWGDVPGWGVDRETPWSELINEAQAEPFIRTLLDVRSFADYRAGGQLRDQLMQRVWRMVDAVHLDTALREKLFTMVVTPVDCADAGAQLFNNMGIHVLAAEAYAYATSSAELELKLVTLAKGAARLAHVNEIARADVASRGGDPDVVEVYLAYQTGLATRLKLPWQTEGMLYRGVSGVSKMMVDQAYDTVLALEQGDGLVDKMLEQDFWQTWLQERYPVRLQANTQRFHALHEQLETLVETQRKWLEATSGEQRDTLREQLRELTHDLPVPDTVVFADEPISDSIYNRLLVDMADEEKALSRSLTRAAMNRAGQ
ncbi:dermonecrotic toxin domain-containing protein [Pseudomonas sp. Eth.TT006]